jgi:glycosyltransferase involved in cell wall biosynthesis
MKLVLCSSFVPFVDGGARFIVEWTKQELVKHGHEVEIVYLPFSEDPDAILSQMMAYRFMDLSEYADRVITFRPPSHAIEHPNKIAWFIHHIRVFYDMWNTTYRPVQDDTKGRALRQCIWDFDRSALRSSRKIFTNSKIVQNRLREFNGIESEVLYPPIFNAKRFTLLTYSDTIVCVSRVEPYKRQLLLVEAMKYTRTSVKLALYGASQQLEYPAQIGNLIQRERLGDRVTFVSRWISENEKEQIIGSALAMAYIPVDEDSYGYPTIEAAHAAKPTLTTTDAGGVLEFVVNGESGLTAEPDPRGLAEAMDLLFMDRAKARLLGHNAQRRLEELDISWDRVVDRLTS